MTGSRFKSGGSNVTLHPIGVIRNVFDNRSL